MHIEPPTVCSLCSLPFLGETNIAFKQLHHEMHAVSEVNSPPGALDHQKSCKIGELPAPGERKGVQTVIQTRLLALSAVLILSMTSAVFAQKTEEKKVTQRDRLEVQDYFRQ